MLRLVFLEVDPSCQKFRHVVQPDLQIKSMKISRRCLILRECTISARQIILEHTSTVIVCYRATHTLAKQKVAKQEITNMPRFQKAFSRQKIQVYDNHANNAGKNATSIVVSSFTIRLRARFAPENNQKRTLIIKQEKHTSQLFMSVLPRRKIQIQIKPHE